MLTAIAATGAGLHVAGYVLAGQASIDSATAVESIAWPVFLFYVGLYGLYTYFVPEADLRHLVLVGLTVAVLAASVLLARAGRDAAVCLAVLMTATVPTVVGYEWFGHRHQNEQLARLASRVARGRGPRA